MFANDSINDGINISRDTVTVAEVFHSCDIFSDSSNNATNTVMRVTNRGICDSTISIQVGTRKQQLQPILFEITKYSA